MKRFDRSSWITLAIALALLVATAVFASLAQRQPADGWMVERGAFGRYTTIIYMFTLPDINPNLQPGDVLQAVEGVPFEQLEAGAAHFDPITLDNWEIGGTVRYTVLRDDSEIDLPIWLDRPPLFLFFNPYLIQRNVDILSTPIYLLMGAFVFFLRPRDRAAQLLFLFAICSFVSDTGNFGPGAPKGVADLFSPAFYWSKIILGDLIWLALIQPLLVHLFLIFPVPKPVVRRHRWIIPLIYSLSLVGSLLYPLLNLWGYDVPGLTFASFFLIPFVIIILVSLLHSLLTIREPIPRMQIRWIAFGGLIGILGLVIVGLLEEYLAETLVGDGRFWFGVLSLLVSLALPLSLIIAVLRYRLWDIDVIINRSLVYGSLTGLLAIIYLGSVVLLQAFFQTVTQQDSEVAIVISTLIIAALFNPLRQRIQRFIDRHFYRRRYDAVQILERFAMTSRDQVDLDTLTTELTGVIQHTLEPTQVSLWLAANEPNHGREHE